jgi:hypothetical protein
VAALAAGQRLVDPDEREGFEQSGFRDVARVVRVEPEVAKQRSGLGLGRGVVPGHKHDGQVREMVIPRHDLGAHLVERLDDPGRRQELLDVAERRDQE